MSESIVNQPTTLSPLPPVLHQGLTAVAFFGFLSFLTSIALFFRLAWRLVTWKRSSTARFNQFIILIFNLIFADIQQSVAFLLNVKWLRSDQIESGAATCWAQGWFVSTGDLASGVFTFAIAIHSFMDIIFNYRLGHKGFLATIFTLWAFIYACAIIGLALYPDDFYSRAGAWCWINAKYSRERLWLHYFWILIAEFGTVVIYGLIFLVLRRRVRESFYTTSDTAIRAQSAAKLIIAYPIVYVVCTLPLVTARLTSMAKGRVSFVELCVAGAMITSNGWLDVLLYSITRRALLFGSEMPGDGATALETFRLRPDDAYGTTTTIEAVKLARSGSRRRQQDVGSGSSHGSTEELVSFPGVKTETTVQIRTDIVELRPIRENHSEGDLSKGRVSLDSRSQKSHN